MTTITYINGTKRDTISVSDRGLNYGDGLFETILSCRKTIPLWSFHYQRLESGCRRLKIPAPLEKSLLDLINPHLDQNIHQIIKIIVTRGPGQQGYRSNSLTESTTIIRISKRVFRPPAYWSEGVAVFCCATRLAKQPILAGIKHLNRLEQVMASMELGDEYQEGLMCTSDQYVIEATSHNLFFVKNGQILTTDLSSAGVAGVMRQYVIELASKLDMPVYSQQIPLSDIIHMDEIFLTNSIDGIWPVKRIDENSMTVGPVTRDLQTRVAELLPYR